MRTRRPTAEPTFRAVFCRTFSWNTVRHPPMGPCLMSVSQCLCVSVFALQTTRNLRTQNMSGGRVARLLTSASDPHTQLDKLILSHHHRRAAQPCPPSQPRPRRSDPHSFPTTTHTTWHASQRGDSWP
eukprot:1968549-Rhodomonas_salina.1